MSLSKDLWEFSKEERAKKDQIYRRLEKASKYSMKALPDELSSSIFPYADEAAFMAEKMMGRDDIQFSDLRAYYLEGEDSKVKQAKDVVQYFLNGQSQPTPSEGNTLLLLEGRRSTGDGEMYIIGDEEGIEQLNELL